MGKFNKTGKKEMPALNTSSLPDLIFTLLFFFMIVTTMREVTLKVEFKVPQATELEKLEKKSLVTFIYVGKPTAEFRKKLGNESRIQLNDSYAEVAAIQDYIIGERASMKEEDQPQMTKIFSEKFNLNQDVKVEKVERPDLFNQYEEHSVWWNIEEKDWLNKVNEGFETIKEKGTSKHGSDTVILLPDKNFGLECVKHFETTKNMKVNHVFENEEEKRYHKYKKAFWMGDSRLKISTIHSFKGWEVLNVILYIPENYFGGNDVYDKIVYTAMTRTRQNLIVINSNKRYWEFGVELPNTWK
jgi:biopolymer transport protein ExbD